MSPRLLRFDPPAASSSLDRWAPTGASVCRGISSRSRSLLFRVVSSLLAVPKPEPQPIRQTSSARRIFYRRIPPARSFRRRPSLSPPEAASSGLIEVRIQKIRLVRCGDQDSNSSCWMGGITSGLPTDRSGRRGRSRCPSASAGSSSTGSVFWAQAGWRKVRRPLRIGCGHPQTSCGHATSRLDSPWRPPARPGKHPSGQRRSAPAQQCGRTAAQCNRQRQRQLRHSQQPHAPGGGMSPGPTTQPRPSHRHAHGRSVRGRNPIVPGFRALADRGKPFAADRASNAGLPNRIHAGCVGGRSKARR